MCSEPGMGRSIILSAPVCPLTGTEVSLKTAYTVLHKLVVSA